MLHNNTNIQTKIITSSAAGIDIFVNYRIPATGQLAAYFKKITSITTTTLDISAELAVIELLSIKNIDASNSNTITLSRTNGTDTVTQVKATLAAGEMLTYDLHKGFTFYTTDGKIKVQTASGGGGGASAWGDITGVLSDQTDLQAALDVKQNTITDSDDIVEGSANLFMTTSERSKLTGIEAGADVTDASNVAAAGAFMKSADDTDDITEGATNKFMTSAEKTKLSGIEALADVTDALNVAAAINGTSSKATPVDTDTLPLIDSAASNVLKYVTWANIKATAKTYFDTLYQPVATALSQIAALSPSNDDIIQRKSGSWVNRTMAQLKTDLSLVKGDVGLGNVDNTSDSTKNSATATLTNKRITKRVGSDTSSATPTINTDNFDVYKLTAQAVDITSFTTNLTGTPNDYDTLTISITGTATRNITWGSSFENGAATLPTATSGTNTLDVMFRWNSTTSKWRCMAQG